MQVNSADYQQISMIEQTQINQNERNSNVENISIINRLNKSIIRHYLLALAIYLSLSLIIITKISLEFKIKKSVPDDNFRLLNDQITFNDNKVFQDTFTTSILIDPFLQEISTKEYKCSWKKGTNYTSNNSSDDYLAFFKNNEGTLNLKVRSDSMVKGGNSHDKTIYFHFQVKDGEYKERWVNIIFEFLHSGTTEYTKSLEFNFNYNSPNKAVTRVTSKNEIKPKSIFTKFNILHPIEDSKSTKYSFNY